LVFKFFSVVVKFVIVF